MYARARAGLILEIARVSSWGASAMGTRRFMSAIVVAVISFGASSVIADSQVEIAFETLKTKGALGGGYLLIVKGAGAVLGHVNAQLIGRGRTPLYCPPTELALNAYNFRDIALAQFERRRSYYKDDKIFNEYPEEAMVHSLLYGLEESFPCK